MQLEKLDHLDTLALIYSATTILFTIILLAIRNIRGSTLRRHALVLCTCLIVLFSGYHAVRWDIKVVILRHDFRELFGYTVPKTFARQVEIQDNVLQALLNQEAYADQKVCAYIRDEQNSEMMPRDTISDIDSYRDAREGLWFSAFYVHDQCELYKRYRAAAYYAGFEDEARAVRDIAFTNEPIDLYHRKFTQ